MKVSLTSESTEAIFSKLREAHEKFNRRYPGNTAARQPVHTVYGGAHLFKAESAGKLGQAARAAMTEYAPDWIAFARALDLPGASSLPDTPLEISSLNSRLAGNAESFKKDNRLAWLAKTVYTRVCEKLIAEAVEDFRIDFEDGYGCRSDAEEDGHAAQAAAEVAEGMKQEILPPFIGIRIKPLSGDLMGRSARTLDIFLSALLERTNGNLPDNFVITLSKANMPEQVEALSQLLKLLESRLGILAGSVKVELMVESTQALLNSRGISSLPLLLEAAGGRCVSVHFGAFDYTASCDVTAAHQSLVHPACDFARNMMKLAVAGTGIWLSDGVTNVLPIGPHRAAKSKSGIEQPALTDSQKKENQEVVHRAWKEHFQHIRHALQQGFYQGWDLHPAQLPARYAAVYSFFLEELDASSLRLKSLMARAVHAALSGNVFDDAASAQGLLNFFLRAINCGAVTVTDLEATGLTIDEIRSNSFVQISIARSS